MHSKHARLDRFISASTGISRRAVKPLLADGRILVDGQTARSSNQLIGEFTRVELDGKTLQARAPRYLMLNKPAGVVSATRDDKYPTALALIEEEEGSDLHIAGRLDLYSTGLLLLTNDGRWSRWLSSPESGIVKRYRVTLRDPVTEEMIAAFAEGMYFDYENAFTRPAGLTIVQNDGTYIADVVLSEGRYHQIKRMFGRFRNEVLALHRYAIGPYILDDSLLPGQHKPVEGLLPEQWS